MGVGGFCMWVCRVLVFFGGWVGGVCLWVFVGFVCGGFWEGGGWWGLFVGGRVWACGARLGARGALLGVGRVWAWGVGRVWAWGVHVGAWGARLGVGRARGRGRGRWFFFLVPDGSQYGTWHSSYGTQCSPDGRRAMRYAHSRVACTVNPRRRAPRPLALVLGTPHARPKARPRRERMRVCAGRLRRQADGALRALTRRSHVLSERLDVAALDDHHVILRRSEARGEPLDVAPAKEGPRRALQHDRDLGRRVEHRPRAVVDEAASSLP